MLSILLGVVCGLAYNLTKPIEEIVGGGVRKPYTPPRAPGRLYTIREGDTLSSIALRETGSAGNWPALYAANVDRIHHEQARRKTKLGPDVIFEGCEIGIPNLLAA